MVAHAIAISPEGDLQVCGRLAAQFRYSKRRVGVAIALDAVATEAGIPDGRASLRVTLGRCRASQQQQGRNECNLGLDNHLVFNALG